MGKVAVQSPSLYAEWRRRMFSGLVLEEPGHAPRVSEQLLQSIWHHQRLLRDQLQCLDGRPVRILHPGYWNQEAGPDFRNALIQWSSGEVLTGDIEIDLQPHGWKGHRHENNPAYRQVVLHVVWDADSAKAASLPTLALQPFLDAPLNELVEWLASDPLRHWVGQCCGPLSELPEARLAELLRQAAVTRLQAKAAQFHARARQVGLEQSLWEGIFAALGYKHNVWPMRRVAELLPSLQPAAVAQNPLVWQALLFGVAGLLPRELPRHRITAGQYLRKLWDIWWRERDRFAETTLPNILWRLSGCRPANHPERRLALAAHWLAAGTVVAKLERWAADTVPKPRLLSCFMESLAVEADEFWSWHWTFRSARLAKPQPLLGAQRATDLAINAVLPWLWMRAVQGKSEAIQRSIEERYFSWPKAEDNSALRLARERLFAGNSCPFIKTAAQQQALLQIARDFCDHSDALCQRCHFPDLVRQLELGDRTPRDAALA